jgi:Ca-activated chloride channel family protein
MESVRGEKGMKKILLLLIIIALPLSLYSQSYKDYLRNGNKLYKDKKYNDAEINYLKSLQQNKNSDKAVFNIGDALYKQGQYDKAAEKFNDLTMRKIDKNILASTYHNLGNTLLQDKKYAECIDAYKQSLRNNPGDYDTKYNLDYARRMLIQQQQQQNQQQQNKQNQNQQNKQQQKQDQNKDNKDNKDKQNQQQQQQGDKNKQQQQKISKEDAQRMLQAMTNEEKNTQKKLKKQERGIRVKSTKPW